MIFSEAWGLGTSVRHRGGEAGECWGLGDLGTRAEAMGRDKGAGDTTHLGPGEGPEESGGDSGGAGGLTITEQLLLSLRLSG